MNLKFDSFVRVGSVLQFSYPTDNRFKVSTRLVARRFLIRSIRDIERNPIPTKWLRRRPDLRRGPVLLRGYDLDKHEWRQFYLSSARSLKPLEIPLRRIALYNPTREPMRLHWVGPVWSDTRFEDQQLCNIIREYNRWLDGNPFVSKIAGVFPYPFRGASHD